MERQQTQMPHPVIRNLKVMIMRVLGLCFLATTVPRNQHGGHLTLMMMLTRCGVSMHLVPPRYGHMQTRGRLDSLVRQSFTMPLDFVTVAQSKRELTPEMVKAALYGPAAAKIPAPKINLAATSAPQFNSAAAAPAT